MTETPATTVEGLWRDPDSVPAETPGLESDPFSDDAALDDAQLLDVRYDGVNGVVGVLLEMRLASMFSEGTTALVTAHGVSSLTAAGDVAPHRMARHVASVVSEWAGEAHRLVVHLGGRSSVAVTAADVRFLLLDVDGLDPAPPDYGDPDEAAVQRGLPQWWSSGRVLQAGRPAPRRSAP